MTTVATRGSRGLPILAGASILACLAVPQQTTAQWRSGGLPVCTAGHNQESPFVIADGNGGAFIGWADWRDSLTSESDTYLQHVNSAGVPSWGDCGVPVCTAAGGQSQPHLTLDGHGGVIAAWADARAGFVDVYAQRIDAEGNALWTPSGVRLSTWTDNKFLNQSTRPTIAPDGTGGAIIAWDERLTGFDLDIWAQRIDANGNLLWSPRGKRVSGAVGFQMFVALVSDSQGGAIITWEDWRDTPSPHVFAQRVSGAGVPYWELDGVRLTPTNGKGIRPTIVSDGYGGAIVGWTGAFPGGSSDIYAQRLGDMGPSWTAGGIVVSAAPRNQQDVTMAAAESGGVVLTWFVNHSHAEWDVYAQKVDSAGIPVWEQDGVPLSTFPGHQGRNVAASDGAGGAYFAWADMRPDSEVSTFSNSTPPERGDGPRAEFRSTRTKATARS